MNTKQYKRLFLVMIIPLALLGWWIAEIELLIESHVMTECEEFKEHFSCVSIKMSKTKLDEYHLNAGGVFLWTGARLTNGLTANIVSNGVRLMEYKDGALREKEIVGAGIEKRIHVGMHAGAVYSGNGPCWLNPVAGNTGDWSLRCLRREDEHFRFANKSVHDKFMSLIETAENEASKMSSRSRGRYIVAMLTPFSAFILLSGLAFLLNKLFFFVKYGAEKQNSSSFDK